MLKLGSCDTPPAHSSRTSPFHEFLSAIEHPVTNQKASSRGEFGRMASKWSGIRWPLLMWVFCVYREKWFVQWGHRLFFVSQKSWGTGIHKEEEWRKMGNLQTGEIQWQIMLKDLEGFSLFHIFAQEDTFTPWQDIWQHLRQEWGTLGLFILHTALCFNVFQDPQPFGNPVNLKNTTELWWATNGLLVYSIFFLHLIDFNQYIVIDCSLKHFNILF